MPHTKATNDICWTQVLESTKTPFQKQIRLDKTEYCKDSTDTVVPL